MADEFNAPKMTIEQEKPAAEASPHTQPAPETPPMADPAPQAGKTSVGAYFGKVSAWFKRTFPGKEYAVIFGFLGFVIAVLIFIIGVWRALIAAAFVTVGVAVGQIADGDPKIVRTIRRFISNRRS